MLKWLARLEWGLRGHAFNSCNLQNFFFTASSDIVFGSIRCALAACKIRRMFFNHLVREKVNLIQNPATFQKFHFFDHFRWLGAFVDSTTLSANAEDRRSAGRSTHSVTRGNRFESLNWEDRVEKKSPAPDGIWTHHLCVMKLALCRWATITAHPLWPSWINQLTFSPLLFIY